MDDSLNSLKEEHEGLESLAMRTKIHGKTNNYHKSNKSGANSFVTPSAKAADISGSSRATHSPINVGPEDLLEGSQDEYDVRRSNSIT